MGDDTATAEDNERWVQLRTQVFKLMLPPGWFTQRSDDELAFVASFREYEAVGTPLDAEPQHVRNIDANLSIEARRARRNAVAAKDELDRRLAARQAAALEASTAAATASVDAVRAGAKWTRIAALATAAAAGVAAIALIVNMATRSDGDKTPPPVTVVFEQPTASSP